MFVSRKMQLIIYSYQQFVLYIKVQNEFLLQIMSVTYNSPLMQCFVRASYNKNRFLPSLPCHVTSMNRNVSKTKVTWSFHDQLMANWCLNSSNITHLFMMRKKWKTMRSYFWWMKIFTWLIFVLLSHNFFLRRWNDVRSCHRRFDKKLQQQPNVVT